MSQNLNKEKEDDEFYDAATDFPAATKSNEEIVEEIIKRQSELSLQEEPEADTSKESEFHDAEVTEAEEKPNQLDEDLAELLEREKLMSVEELQLSKEEADKLKLQGNDLFKEDKAIEAIEIYSEALKICPTKYTKERAVLYGNRAAAKIKIDAKKSAIEDCTKAVELWPEYVRVFLRRAKLFECEDKLDESLSDYKRVLELDPGQHEAREAAVRLPPLINERNERMKEEMMSKLKDLGNMILKPFGLSTNNFQMQQDPNTGGYSINFNQK